MAAVVLTLGGRVWSSHNSPWFDDGLTAPLAWVLYTIMAVNTKGFLIPTLCNAFCPLNSKTSEIMEPKLEININLTANVSS